MRSSRALIISMLTLMVGCPSTKDEPEQVEPSLAPAQSAAPARVAPAIDPRAEPSEAPPSLPPEDAIHEKVTPEEEASEEATPEETTPEEANKEVPQGQPCVPDCLLRACGADGCGGTCGACKEDEGCRKGRCVADDCAAECEGKTCGPDGCDGTCGRCPPPGACVAGLCRPRIGVGLFGGRPGTPGDGIPRAVENLYVGFPAAWSGPCDYGRFPRKNADRILARNPAGAVLITLLPECGFTPFTSDFSEGSRPYLAVKELAEGIAALGTPVIVRIAPQMNAPWFSWGPCALDNKDQPCLDDASKYREGFANIARLLKAHGGPHLSIAWTPLAEPGYWRESLPEYPTYEDFYPGDDVVDYVGLDLSWTGEEPPSEGAFVSGIEPFYQTWAAPEGHGKLMIVAETTAECRLTEEINCVGPVAGFEGIEGWWGPWGRLRLEASEGGASEDCAEIPNGERHLLLSTTPDEEGSTSCSDYYVGGLALPLEWGEGVDLSGGNAFRIRARKDPSGSAPTLQIELCDTTAPACTGKDRCCVEESVTATVTVDSLEWRTWTIAFEDFSPAVPGTSPDMDWSRVRSLKLHVVCPDQRGPLAPLHLDGFGVSRITRPGEAECDERRRAWARQVFAPELCTSFPRLDMVLWRQGLRRTPEAIFDGRIRDPEFWRELWKGDCFAGTWF